MIKINIWELWEKEWKNAYNFFNTKGNIKTKARLKAKWYNEFKEMLKICSGLKDVAEGNVYSSKQVRDTLFKEIKKE